MSKHLPGAIRAAARIIDFLGITKINGIHATVANIITEETAAGQDELLKANAESKSVLIHCYQYMMGNKPGPNAATLTCELQKIMDELGVTGISKSAALAEMESKEVKK